MSNEAFRDSSADGCAGADHAAVRWLLLTEEEQTEEPDVVYLWDNKVGAVSNGINYFDREAGEEPS